MHLRIQGAEGVTIDLARETIPELTGGSTLPALHRLAKGKKRAVR
jgi:hypothetical protein